MWWPGESVIADQGSYTTRVDAFSTPEFHVPKSDFHHANQALKKHQRELYMNLDAAICVGVKPVALPVLVEGMRVLACPPGAVTPLRGVVARRVCNR